MMIMMTIKIKCSEHSFGGFVREPFLCSMYNREDRIIGVCRGTYIFLRYMVISCAASARGGGPVVLELVNDKIK